MICFKFFSYNKKTFSYIERFGAISMLFRLINRHFGFFSPEGRERERELLQYSFRVSRVLGNSSVTVVSCLWNFTIYGWDKQ